MSRAGKPVLFQGHEYPSITALGKIIGKTVSQLKNHIESCTPVIGYEPDYIDFKLLYEDVEKHKKKVKKLNERLNNRVKSNNYE